MQANAQKYQGIKEWSASMRINHWAVAVSIFMLIVTGFYIADPFTISAGETGSKFFMGNVRFVHILFGAFLIFLTIWRLYMAFFSRFHADWKDFMAWTDLKAMVEQIKFYLLISEHPEKKYLYGPMQALAYIGCWMMVVVIIITGLILMAAGYHAGLTFSGRLCVETDRESAGRVGRRSLHSPCLHLAVHLVYRRSYLHGFLV